jgi:hypothetical protein
MGDLIGVLNTEMIPISAEDSVKDKILADLEKQRISFQKDDPYNSYSIQLDRIE